MSIILPGDLFQKLGTHLPTPIIERIEVFADSIEAYLNLYFKLDGLDPDGIQQAQIEKDLTHLNIYATTVYGDTYASSIINRNSSIFDELYTSAYDTSFQSASYLKLGADIGLYYSASSIYETDAGQDFMVNTVNWDFNGDGEFTEDDTEYWRLLTEYTGNLDPDSSAITFGYSRDWITLNQNIDIPDAVDPESTTGLPIHKTGLEWGMYKLAQIFEQSGTLQALQAEQTQLNYIDDPSSVVKDFSRNFAQIPFDLNDANVTRSDDPMYDESGNLILKYQVVAKIIPQFKTLRARGAVGSVRCFSKFDESVNIFNSLDYALNSHFNKSMTLFAFTSFVDYEEVASNGATGEPTYGVQFSNTTDSTDDNYRKWKNPKPDLQQNLMYQQTSDLSYKKLFTNGQLDLSAESMYMYADNNKIFSGTPIRSITGIYYDDSQLTIDSLLSSIVDLGNGTLDSLSAETEESQNSLLLLAAEYGRSPDLLQELDRFRRSFPNKTSNLYENLKKLVISSNRLLKKGNPVTKVLITNNVVVDKRDDFSDITDYQSTYNDNIFPIYAKSAFVGSEVNATMQMDGYYPIITTGYLLFDQEMALRYNSNICKVLDVHRLESIFGKEITNTHFYVTYAETKKWLHDESIQSEEDLSDQDFNTSLMTIRLHNDYPNGPADQLAAFASGAISIQTNEEHTGVPQLYSTIDFNGFNQDDQFSYMIPRAFDLYINTVFTGSERSFTVGSEDGTLTSTNYAFGFDSNYRMQCFEFQEISTIAIEGASRNHLSMYSFEVKVQDNSHQIVEAISGSYQSALLALEEYVGYASEHCSYNNLEGKFNDFFKDAMRSIYGDLEAFTTPWIQAASTYYAHVDLLLGVFDGSKERMVTHAKETAQLINPTNGDLDNLLSFYNTMSSFYDSNYGPGGEIAQRMEGLQSVQRVYPISENPRDACFAPLPEPSVTYAFILEEIDQSWTTRWETLMGYLQTTMDRVYSAFEWSTLKHEDVPTPYSIGEIPKYVFCKSYSEIHAWLEGGARSGPDGDGVTSYSTNFPVDDETNEYWVAASDLAIVLDSIRKFNIFTVGPKEGQAYKDDLEEQWPIETLQLFKTINEIYMAPYLEEAKNTFLSYKKSVGRRFDVMDNPDFSDADKSYIAKKTDGQGYYDKDFRWTQAWPIGRISNEYGFTAPANITYGGDGYDWNTGIPTLDISNEIPEIKDINYNVTNDWITVNNFDETTFSEWLAAWAPSSYF